MNRPQRSSGREDASLPVRFEPEYGPVVTRVLPAVVAMMSLCGGLYLYDYVSAPDPLVLSFAVFAFLVAASFPGLYLWFLIYREIVFDETGVTVRRYGLPDRRAPYEEVSAVGSTGFRLAGFPVTCHTMENASELRAILRDLSEAGRIPDRDGGLGEAMKANVAATVKAALLGIGLVVGMNALGIELTFLPEPYAEYVVIVAALIVGAPLFKRAARR